MPPLDCGRVVVGHVSVPGGGSEATMRTLRQDDVDVTVIEIDSDDDGMSDEELVIIETKPGGL